MKQIDRVIEILKNAFTREELPKDLLPTSPEERSIGIFLAWLLKPDTLPTDHAPPLWEKGSFVSFLSWLFKPEALSEDPLLSEKEKNRGLFGEIFALESLPREKSPEDAFIKTSGRGSSKSFFSLLFKPDALSEDLLLPEKEKGLLQNVLARETLPVDREEN